MEFLVRLDDKVNTQVFCLNPVHKGNHMDRVFFEDDTFEASCPECGSGEYLYRKNNAISKKGHFITFKPDGWTWGTNERKHYGIARIDCTEEQAKEWCEGIRNDQAMADAERYRKQADDQGQIVIENVKESMPAPNSKEKLDALKKAIKEALESDLLYKAYQESERQADNRAQIDHRHRKQAFDFEKVLTSKQLQNWNDMRTYSEIVSISEQDKAQIKESVYATNIG